MAELYSNGRIEIVSGHKDSPRPFNYHSAKFKKSDVDFINVSGYRFLGTGTYYFNSRATKFGRPPDLIKQGDEGDYDKLLVKGLGVSDGSYYKASPSETNVQWDKDSNILGIAREKLPGCYNATGGANWLLDNGKIHPSVLDEFELDPRSGLGWNDEYYFFVIIDGRNDGTQGLSKAEFAQFFLDIGAINAHMSDGGDSDELGVNDNGQLKIINNLVEGKEHRLIQYIGVWLKPDQTSAPTPAPVESEEYMIHIKGGVEVDRWIKEHSA